MREKKMKAKSDGTTNALKGPPASDIGKGELAVRKLASARKAKKEASRYGCPVSEIEANRLTDEALELLEVGDIQPLSGGEAVETDDEDHSLFRETLKDPNGVSVGASIGRLRLLDEMHSLEMAVDAAETIEADNSLEKMLAHQMTAMHVMAMRLMAKASRHTENLTTSYTHPSTDQAVKVVNAAARLMDTYQRGLATIAKIRTGGRQKVTVEHVHVNAGGQAIVGNVNQGGGASKNGETHEK